MVGESAPVKGDWRNYIKGLLVDLKRRGIKFGASDAVLDSQVPLSAGMSSSAALEMSFAFALKTIYGIELPLADWARVGQAVENKFLGLNSGLLDQFSSLFGKKDSFILCDFRTVDSDGKESDCNVGDPGLISGSGRSPGEGNGNPLQHSCLENPMDEGA